MKYTNQMNHFIDEQFELLPKLLAEDIQVEEGGHEYEKIVFVGSGSSLNAARISERYFAETSSAQCFFLSPNQYLPQSAGMGRHLLVAISQTGTSIATIDSIIAAKKRAVPTILISATKDTRKREVADQFIDLYCEDEKIGPKTVGFSATVVRLIQLAMAFNTSGETRARNKAELLQIIHALPIIKKNTEAWIETHQEWKQATYITVASDEEFKAAIDEGALKLLETLMVPVPAYEIGEFTHGPHRLLKAGSHHIFIGSGQTSGLTQKVAEYAKEQQANILCFTLEEGDIDLTPITSSFGVELAISIVFQVLANELALLHGFNPDEKVHQNFFKFIGTKD